MAKKIILELNEIQARTVLVAVEEWFRLRMGQTWDLAADLGFMGYKHDPENKSAFDERIQRRDVIREILGVVMRIAFPGNGVPTSSIPEVHVASDIWSALRWELSEKGEWDRTPFQMGPEPLPKITVEETE